MTEATAQQILTTLNKIEGHMGTLMLFFFFFLMILIGKNMGRK